MAGSIRADNMRADLGAQTLCPQLVSVLHDQNDTFRLAPAVQLRWPGNLKMYSEQKWEEYQALAAEHDVKLTLKGRADPRRPQRHNQLTVKGQEWKAVLSVLLVELEASGLNWAEHGLESLPGLLPQLSEQVANAAGSGDAQPERACQLDEGEAATADRDPGAAAEQTRAWSSASSSMPSQCSEPTAAGRTDVAEADSVDHDQASSSVPTQRPESTQGPEDIWTLPRLVDLVEAAFHVQHAAGLPEDIVEQFSRAANGLRERFGGMPRRSTPGRQQATTVRALYLCTACVWRHAQLLPAMFFNAILLCHWRMQSQANLSLCWSLVLAADGQTGPTLEALVILRPLFEAAKIEVLLAFADLSPTAGFFHMSWAKNSSHRLAADHAVALGRPAEATVLCNLDADNLVGEQFLDCTLEAFHASGLLALHARGIEAATTGRVLVRLSVWPALNGYDQEADTWGSGYQDVDLLHRVKTLGRVELLRRADGHRTTGYALPNDPKNQKKDRSSAKIVHVQNVPTGKALTWGQSLVV
ncbi:unnamed protein product [Symbiodinium natans]|uniref:Uncharacterized protein n=1 Tax=Symbiodinium natans TaxID=878477 RepID=A0A812UKS1_9DINO|nr:unnamed protein product [Symbiodinium natans]